MRIRGGLAAGLVLAAACQPAPRAMDDARRSAITDSIKAEHRALWAALNTRNADTIMAFFTHDVTFADAGKVFPSYDSIVSMSRTFFAGVRSVAARSEEPRIAVLGPDAAVLTTLWSESVTDTAGHTTEMTGAWSAVYQRRNGRWMITHAHESFPGPEPQLPAPARRRT